MTTKNSSPLSPASWGRWVAEPRAFLVLAPFWLVFSLLGVPGIESPWVFAVAILANAVALTGCFGVLIIARNTVFAHRESEQVRILAVVGVGLLIGVTKALITVSLIVVLVPDPDYFQDLPSRLLASISAGVLLVPASAVFLATRERFRTARELLLRDLASGETVWSVDYRKELVAAAKDVQSFAQRATVELEKRKTEPVELRRYLREVLQRNLRKLTHDLSADPTRAFRRSENRDIVATTILAQSYPVATVTIGYLLLSAPFVIFQAGLVEGTGRTAISTGLLVSFLWALRKIPISSFARTFSVLLSTLIGWSLLNELAAFVAFGTLANIPFWATVFANVTVALAPILLLGAVTVATDEHKSIRGHLDGLLSEKYWQKDLATLHTIREKRALTHQLHGRLQNVLLATLARLKKDPDSLDFDALSRELNSLSEDLDDMGRPSQSDVPPLAEGLDELRHRWGEILNVEITVDATGQRTSAEDLRAILDVTEESISNAVRHGMATAVAITIDISATGISVVTQDNGIGPRLGEPGLGTLLFSSLHSATWSLEENELESGSTVTVRWVS